MNQEAQHIYRSFQLATIFVLLIWVTKIIEFVCGYDLAATFGLYPRSLQGLLGIFSSPFVHGDWNHLISNTMPLLILSVGIFYFYWEIAWKAFAYIYLITGIWVWVAARPSYHIGASGVIYGLAFFLFFSGIFRKDPRSLALSLLVSFLYGSMVWGVLPIKEGMSWESHLFGALAGTFIAYWLRKEGPQPPPSPWEDEAPDTSSDQYASWNYRNLYPPPEGFTYPEKRTDHSD